MPSNSSGTAVLDGSGARRASALGFAALLTGGVAIGFAGIMMRWSDVNPLASAFWRMALAAPLLWAWAWSTRGRDRASGKRTGFSLALLLAGLSFAGDMGLWHLSLHYTTVSNATLLSNLAPLFIALWMWLAYRARFAPGFVAGLGIALGGAFLLVAPAAPGSGPSGAGKLLGDAFGLGSALFYAAYQLAIKDARNQYSTALLMAWSSTITALALLPFALAAPGAFWPAAAAGWIPLLGMALIAQIGGQTVIAYASAHLPAALSSVGLLIQPLTATLAAWFFFAEAVGPVQAAGGALLLFGIYLSRRSG
ncbi:MAG: DMT family transporter [Noviherbaspirillum sp.]